MARLILLSFSSTLNAVATGKLTEADLSTAIFFFGNTKDYTCETPVSEVLRIQFGNHDMEQGVMAKTVETVRRHARAAAEDKRALWRKDENNKMMEPSAAQAALSQLLKQNGLQPLNPNLPPADPRDNKFLQIAIERVNNKDGLEMVRVWR
jgi:hypothetical protein